MRHLCKCKTPAVRIQRDADPFTRHWRSGALRAGAPLGRGQLDEAPGGGADEPFRRALAASHRGEPDYTPTPMLSASQCGTP